MSVPSQEKRRRDLTLGDYAEGVLAGDRAVLARAITLVESRREDHQDLAQELLLRLLPHTGGSIRVGVTGVPGVGKSTFIEALGTRLTGRGHRLAVLTVDPTSSVSRGSILGDKTRMEALARDEAAFIRPSPTGGSLGGVGRKTRETILLCEAAGYDVVLVETVGVGQSETLVAQMVDFFLLLILAGGGDELQGIKRGIMELADLVAITKADGENVERAINARREYSVALRFLLPRSELWKPSVVTVSALEGKGIPEIWEQVRNHHRRLEEAGELRRRRLGQRIGWMWAMVDEGMRRALEGHPEVARRLPELERQIEEDTITPTLAAREILAALIP